jgi:hypothetical protein
MFIRNKGVLLPKKQAMYLFNTTFYVDNEVMKAWQEWFQATYLPLMQASGKFSKPLVYRVHSFQNEDDSSSIAVQFSVESMDDIRQWDEEISQLVEHSMAAMFGAKALHFWTVLEPLS